MTVKGLQSCIRLAHLCSLFCSAKARKVESDVSWELICWFAIYFCTSNCNKYIKKNRKWLTLHKMSDWVSKMKQNGSLALSSGCRKTPHTSVELLRQALRSLLAALQAYISAVMYACQLPQNVLRGFCGRWLLSLNNKLCFNILNSQENNIGLTSPLCVARNCIIISHPPANAQNISWLFYLWDTSEELWTVFRLYFFYFITNLIKDYTAATSPDV